MPKTAAESIGPWSSGENKNSVAAPVRMSAFGGKADIDGVVVNVRISFLEFD